MKNSKYLVLLILAISFGISGCASITGTSGQTVSVQTNEGTGKHLTGSICALSNNKGRWFVTSPGSVGITRSNDDLQILCNKDNYEPGRTVVASTIKAAMFGNIIFGGLIGVALDHSSGAAYEYPPFIQVMMGGFQDPAPQKSAEKSPVDLPQLNATNIQPPSSNNKVQAKGKVSAPKLAFNASTPSADGSIELSGRITSNIGISGVSINDRALEIPLAKDGSFKVVRRLPVGVTNYRLSVTDEFGQRSEAEVKVERATIQYVEEFAQLDPRKIKAKVNSNAVALIIGVESYSNLPPAQHAGSDATYFYDYATQALGVPTNKIKLLTDSKANRAELLLAMRGWMKTEVVNEKSDVYIFFAGHGLASADGNKIYLLPADGHRDLLDETSILRNDLIASATGAKTITLFLDTCFSGGTRTNEVLLADARPIAIIPDVSILPQHVTILAASSGSQLSSTYEAAQQGLFSYWLMKGMEGNADTNKDKKITAGELHDYVSKNVGPMAQRRNRQQDPQLMGDSTRVLVSY